MRYVQIGQDNVSRIGLGTWQFGAKEWGWTEAQRTENVRIIQRAVELGINLIDTAEGYSFGKSESIIGEALVGLRDRVFLTTKHNPLWPTPGRIQKTARASLQRLQTPAMELYQMHWPNPVIPLGWQMKGMRRVHEAGLAKYIGVSNFPLWLWRRAERKLGLPIMTNQVHFNLLRRKAQKLLPWAQANNRTIIAYSPLAQGFLSAKYTTGNAPGGIRRINFSFLRSNIDAAQPLLTSLREIAQKHSATPAQIALAWVIHHPNVVAIPGAKNVAQLEQNAAAGDIQLSEDQFTRLTESAERIKGAGIKAMPQLLGRIFGKAHPA